MAKSYEIEIAGNWLDDGVNADIKYPCGEVIESWHCDSILEASEKVNAWIKINPYQPHKGCRSEYCLENV